jgi:hypothetical protein
MSVFLSSVLFLPVLGLTGESEDDGGAGELAMTAFADIPYAEAIRASSRFGIDPRLMTAIIKVETDFVRSRIECPEGATGPRGVLQLDDEKAEEFGIDPCDGEEAIFAAAGFLSSAFEALDDWELTLAAYKTSYEEVAATRGVPSSVRSWVTQVMDTWTDYRNGERPEVPPDTAAPGGQLPIGDCSWTPEGSTAPVLAGNNTAANQLMANSLIACFGRNGYYVGCYDPRVNEGRKFEHPRGRACDFMITSGGVASGHERARGQAMAEYAAAHAAELHIIYVIWFNKVWNPSDGNISWESWRSYGCGDCGPSGGHFNHVHVSVHLQPGDPPIAHCVSGIPCTE